MDFAADLLGQVIAELDGAEFGVAAILDEVARDALLVVVVHGADGGDVAAHVRGAPGIEQTVALIQVADVQTAPEVGLTLEVRDDIYALHTLPEHGEVPVLVLQVDVQAPGEVGHGAVDPFLVLLVDNSVLVEVLPADAAEAGTVLGGVVVYLVLTLEDAVIDVADLCAKGMTDNALYAVATKGATCGDGLGQLGHFVAIGTDVARQVVAEVAHAATIADVELHTFVLHLAGVDPLATALTHDTDTGHINKDVLGLLVVPLQGAVEGVAEEAEVQTDIGLRGGLPLQVVVTELVALETAGKGLAAVGAGDVVAGAVALATKASLAVVALVECVAGNVRDFLVTRLTPAGAQLQVVEPVNTLHEAFLADTPTGTDAGEGSVFIILTEATAAVMANGEAGQIAVGVGVVDFTKE